MQGTELLFGKKSQTVRESYRRKFLKDFVAEALWAPDKQSLVSQSNPRSS
jgi:hypothetical protein